MTSFSTSHNTSPPTILGMVPGCWLLQMIAWTGRTQQPHAVSGCPRCCPTTGRTAWQMGACRHIQSLKQLGSHASSQNHSRQLAKHVWRGLAQGFESCQVEKQRDAESMCIWSSIDATFRNKNAIDLFTKAWVMCAAITCLLR